MFEILAALDVVQLFTGQMSLTDIRRHVMAESRGERLWRDRLAMLV
jgi:hypothetical protein